MRSICNHFLVMGSFALLIQPVFASNYMNTVLLKSYNSITSNSGRPVIGMNQWDSLIDNSEVRVGANDLSGGLGDQTYSLRFRLKNKKQRVAEHDLLGLLAQKENADRHIFRLSLLGKNYLDVLAILELKHKVNDAQQRLKLAKLEASTYKKLVSTSAFDPSKIQRAEIEVNRLTSEQRLYNQSLNSALSRLGVPVNNKAAVQRFLDYKRWSLSMEEMLRVVDRPLGSELPLNNPILEKLIVEKQIASKQSQRAKADLSTSVSLMEVEYDNDKDSFGATFGVKIPFGKSSFDTLMRDSGRSQAQQAWDMKLQTIQNSLLESKLALYRHYDAYKQQQQLQHSLNSRLKRVIKTSQPALILSLKKEQAKSQSNQQAIYLNMLGEYIRYINTSGQMVEKPLRNWLQKNQPRIGR